MNRRKFIGALSSAAVFQTLRGHGRTLRSGGPLSQDFRSESTPLTVTTTRFPYIQDVRNNRVSILWATLESGLGVVEYSSDGIHFDSTVATQRRFEASESGGPADFVQYEGTITGLQPSTDYVYRVSVSGLRVAAGGETRFRTAGPGPFNFVVLGDSGIASDDQIAVAQNILAEKPAFVIHTGDVVYMPGGAVGTSIDLYQRNYFNYYYATMSSAPFFPTPGNHDFGPALTPYLSIHSLPKDSTPVADRGRYYSYDWGNVHFVSLDAHESVDNAVNSGGLMLRWLDDDLQSTNQFWRVVYFHYPPFAAGPNMNDPHSGLIRQYVVPILEKYGVQVVLSGHEHSYQRSQPMRNSSFVAPEAGTSYIASGGGGASLYAVYDGFPIVAFGQSVHHHLRAEVRGTRLTFHAIRHDGVELDTYTIAPAPLLADDPNVQPVALRPGPLSSTTIKITGRNLGEEVTFSSAPKPQTAMAGTVVTVNGAPIPLLYVSPTEIYGHLPGSVNGNITVRVTTGNGFLETSV
jgi:Calcineurin-like phosphoesterase/IPT/TIG domain